MGIGIFKLSEADFIRVILSTITGGSGGGGGSFIFKERPSQTPIQYDQYEGLRRTTGITAVESRFFPLLAIIWRMALRSVRSGWKLVRSMTQRILCNSQVARILS
jgi:hypothetical protein